MNNMKRMFIGCSIEADWPRKFPVGKILTKENRHLTLAFLGTVETDKLPIINNAPKPKFNQTPVGEFDEILALPKQKPSSICYHAHFTIEEQAMFDYQKQLVFWLSQQQFLMQDRTFLPHVTIARAPFKKHQWVQHFKPFSFLITGMHLYESMGHSQYQILKTLKKNSNLCD